MSFTDRVKGLVAYVDTFVQCNLVDHVVFIDAPHPDEVYALPDAIGIFKDKKYDLMEHLHLVFFVDNTQTFLGEKRITKGAEEEVKVLTEMNAMDFFRTGVPGFQVVACSPMRNATAFATLFGSFKRTHHQETYRADTLTIPAEFSIEFSRTACLYASPNVLRSSLTVGSRTFTFKGTPNQPVQFAFFAGTKDKEPIYPDLSDLSGWHTNAYNASEQKIASKACTGGIDLMHTKQESKAIIDADTCLRAIHDICIMNAKQKWAEIVNIADKDSMDALMPPPSKRPCLVPAHSCSVPY